MNLIIIITASWLAGLAAFIGGTLAHFEGSAETETKREIIHGVVAFGGGILLAAVAFSLAPEGIAMLSPITLCTTFLAGGLLFCFIDALINRKQGSKAQFLAMLLDFVPESIALGALFSQSKKAGMLLVLFIAAQNLPEGFNTHRENITAGMKSKTSLLSLLGVSLLGPISACSGYFFLGNYKIVTAGMMSFASGGILYLIFQDIAPQSKLEHHWSPSLGAVLGFAFGMLGKQLLG